MVPKMTAGAIIVARVVFAHVMTMVTIKGKFTKYSNSVKRIAKQINEVKSILWMLVLIVISMF